MEQGEPSAAEALLEHRGFVRALARSLVDLEDGDRADDLAQEALVAGLAQPPKCARAWRSWLRSTVHRLHWNVLRSKRRNDLRERAAAQREALPSTAALVLRLELEQRVVAAVLTLPAPERTVVLLHFYDGQGSAAIAASLGVPADTVRARLRRALARLREQLDRSCGDRAGWQRGLAALALGGAVMSSKLVLASLAAGVVAAATWFALPERFGGFRDEPSELASRDASRRAAAGSSEPDAALAAELAEPARVALPSGDDAEAIEAAALELPPPGQVAFHVIDAETRAAIDPVEIRFLNETRYARFEGGGAGRVQLTAGSWSARITASGREPAEIAGLDVTVGQVTELGTVELFRGSGRIEGRVTARGVAESALTVELRGAGRSPCARCRATREKLAEGLGADCGFGEELSRIELADGDSFRFADLAAGTYWLRAVDATTQLVDSRRVDVARNGSEWVDLDVSLPTTLAVELRHSSGHHFTGVWAHPYGEEPARIDFQVRVGEKARGVARAQPTAADVRSTMGPPGSIGEAVDDGGRFVAETGVAQQLVEYGLRLLEADADAMHAAVALRAMEMDRARLVSGAERIDRERLPADGLVPEPERPDLTEVTLAVERLRPDSFLLGPLPRASVTLTVVSDVYVSKPLDVDLRFGFTGPLLVTLFPRSVDDPLLPADHPVGIGEVSRSCLSCHDSAATAQLREIRESEISGLELLRARELDLQRARAEALSAEAALRERE